MGKYLSAGGGVSEFETEERRWKGPRHAGVSAVSPQQQFNGVVLYTRVGP